MSVQELNVVHRRYIRLSNYFKSAWTFHQFIQGLRKVFTDLELPDYPADFQVLYGELKQVADSMSASTVDTVTQQLDEIESKLQPLVDALQEVDGNTSPELLRKFFQRVKNYDDNILSQLVKFYLYSDTGAGLDPISGDGDGSWDHDRLDKADYLVTKLAETYQDWKDAFVLRDQTHLREMTQGLVAALGTQPLPPAQADRYKERIVEIRSQLSQVESVDQLHDKKMVQRYRDLKHDLGRRFFDPHLLPELLATNIDLKNHVHRLYKRDEQRIIAEYQEVFELERDFPLDRELTDELSEFRDVVERFEEQLAGGNVKIEDVAVLRNKVRSLTPRLRTEPDTQAPQVPPPEVREFLANEHGESLTFDPGTVDSLADYVEAHLGTLVEALDDTNSAQDAKRVALQPEVFGFGVKPREIIAYRRLYGNDPDCDRELEWVILRAAALRVRIADEVDEIKSILDDSAVSRDAPIYRQARVTCLHADRLLYRLSHEIEQRVLGEDTDEARVLKSLKMRLMRSFSGLWLMVYN
ncbi:MAG: hypothetical protein MPN21_22560 [Thermoanaerobaculia bacterium]|nr:hypothetical protein [Thermoanaerobaculia bacterium]